jgi:hypothetical protein
MTPHLSQGSLYEDGLSALYSKFVTVKLSRGDFDVSIFEDFYAGVYYRQGRSLQDLEQWVRGATAVYLAAAGTVGKEIPPSSSRRLFLFTTLLIFNTWTAS